MQGQESSHGAGASAAPEEGVAHVGAALDYVTDAVILLEHDWTIEFVNVAFERASGRQREALIGRNYWTSLSGAMGERFDVEARSAMQTRAAHIYEEFNARLSKWFECRAFPCEHGLVVLFIDITTRKADELTRVDFEEKLMRIQRMESLGTLAGGVAHDFNNILAAILGHAGMMLDELPATSPLRGHMQQIKRAGDRAREIVQRILAYARGSSHELSKHRLRPLVEDSIGLLRSTLPASVRLTVDLHGDDCVATVDPAEVQQVVLNLCTNAWQAMPGGHGQLHVGLRAVHFDVPHAFAIGRVAPTHYAELSVRDDGHGMEEDVAKRLFEPFFTTKPRGQGTGLGLHIVHGIVHAHGGAIDVQSRPGTGTVFSVYLPVVGSETATLDTAALAKVAEPGVGEHVLYVDDDPIVLMMVEALLKKSGYDVRTYAEPTECLADIESGRVPVQLLITDFNMPGMNGLELAVAVRTTLPTVPVIITTGYIGDELTDAADRMGGVAVLQKERSFEELVELAALALRGFPESRFLDTGLSPL
ncbi:ATP-binding protein [Mitsuaria sp. 7]|uniref:hybrid sensor histidine kinase/response regulator n=1 Tax=Mitsuaria sp. 7 TaxID=1658665 RepID=UPI00082AA15B|nr:ATP-binding protein [Mitsuaria sp. 7]